MNAVDRLADHGDATLRQARAGTSAYPAVAGETSASKGGYLSVRATWIMLLLLAAGLSSPAIAKLPEPPAVYYGQFFQFKQVASALGTAEQTIKIHRARVLEKFGVTSVAELVRIAARLGIEAA